MDFEIQKFAIFMQGNVGFLGENEEMFSPVN